MDVFYASMDPMWFTFKKLVRCILNSTAYCLHTASDYTRYIVSPTSGGHSFGAMGVQSPFCTPDRFRLFFFAYEIFIQLYFMVIILFTYRQQPVRKEMVNRPMKPWHPTSFGSTRHVKFLSTHIQLRFAFRSCASSAFSSQSTVNYS